MREARNLIIVCTRCRYNTLPLNLSVVISTTRQLKLSLFFKPSLIRSERHLYGRHSINFSATEEQAMVVVKIDEYLQIQKSSGQKELV